MGSLVLCRSVLSRVIATARHHRPSPPIFACPRRFCSSLSRSPLLHLRPLVCAAGHVSFTASASLRCFSTRQTSSSLNDPNPNWSNRPPKETILLDGCDFEHWLVVMEKPEGDPTRDEIIESYIKTLAMVVGSEEEARMKIYSVSTRCYFAFGALVSEELSYKLKELPKVRWVLPDSYLDVKNKDYGGEPFINGQAVPYDPKYHEEWIRNNNRANERNRRNDRPRNFDRSRNFERRTASNMPPRPPPTMGGSQPASNMPPTPPGMGGIHHPNSMPPPPSPGTGGMHHPNNTPPPPPGMGGMHHPNSMPPPPPPGVGGVQYPSSMRPPPPGMGEMPQHSRMPPSPPPGMGVMPPHNMPPPPPPGMGGMQQQPNMSSMPNRGFPPSGNSGMNDMGGMAPPLPPSMSRMPPNAGWHSNGQGNAPNFQANAGWSGNLLRSNNTPNFQNREVSIGGNVGYQSPAPNQEFQRDLSSGVGGNIGYQSPAPNQEFQRDLSSGVGGNIGYQSPAPNQEFQRDLSSGVGGSIGYQSPAPNQEFQRDLSSGVGGNIGYQSPAPNQEFQRDLSSGVGGNIGYQSPAPNQEVQRDLSSVGNMSGGGN